MKRFKVSSRAFTLMEMITVMAIATLITIASAPAFMNFSRTQRLRGAASEISSALNYARRNAITSGISRAVVIYDNGYSDDAIMNSFLFPETDEVWERKLIHRTVVISDVAGPASLPDGEYAFEFTPRGALTGVTGTITLEDTVGRTVEITVYNTTGRVRVGDLQEP